MSKQIPVTVNFDKTKQVGVLTFNNNAVFIDGNPIDYHFAPALQKNPDGSMELVEISLVPNINKYVGTEKRIKENVICFICGKDITNSTKVISYHNYPYQYWDMKKEDWDKELPNILNGAMCQECAKLDLELAHNVVVNKIDLKAIIKLEDKKAIILLMGDYVERREMVDKLQEAKDWISGQDSVPWKEDIDEFFNKLMK